jgi:fatty-acyl-CoA synthase
VTDAHDPLGHRLYSQGLPLPGMTIRAVDPMTREVPANEIGELVVKGYVTPGYYRAPELNAIAFDQSGGFLTGDLGSIDRHGRVRFRGRLKEMIKTGGINVAPLEVEEVLQAHVVGIPDAAKGEIVAAAIAPQPSTAADAAAIIAFCRERLASYKVPVRLAFYTADQLPRTPTGKIHKPSLVAAFAAASGCDAGTASS